MFAKNHVSGTATVYNSENIITLLELVCCHPDHQTCVAFVVVFICMVLLGLYLQIIEGFGALEFLFVCCCCLMRISCVCMLTAAAYSQ